MRQGRSRSRRSWPASPPAHRARYWRAPRCVAGFIAVALFDDQAISIRGTTPSGTPFPKCAASRVGILGHAWDHLRGKSQMTIRSPGQRLSSSLSIVGTFGTEKERDTPSSKREIAPLPLVPLLPVLGALYGLP